jgi:hypothetical protein
MASQKFSTAAIIAIAVTGVLLTLTTAGLVSTINTIPATGTVTSVGVRVYSDSGLTRNATSIDWGSMSPGGNINKLIYLKNTGTVPIALSMTETAWNPVGANGPITMTWDKEGTVLAAGQATTATLTLSVLSSISGITTFSFNVVLTGTP